MPPNQYLEKDRVVQVSHPPVITGGYSRTKWIMKTKAYQEHIFVELKPHADWLMAVVCGSNRKSTGTKLQGTQTWQHFSGCVSSQIGDVTNVDGSSQIGNASESQGQQDAFANALKQTRGASSRTHVVRRSTSMILIEPTMIRVDWPEPRDSDSLHFLMPSKPGCTSTGDVLWILQTDLGDLVNGLIKERHIDEGKGVTEDITTSASYDTVKSQWSTKWMDLTTKTMQECVVKVDRRKRTSTGHVLHSPESFLKRKKSGRERLRIQASAMGCPHMWSDDDGTACTVGPGGAAMPAAGQTGVA